MRWDGVFGLPYQRVPHPAYGNEKIPAYDMIKTSVNIMRGCFGGCSFCSITQSTRAHHPEPLGRVDPQRNRRDPRQGAGLYRRHLGSGRPHRQHVPLTLQEPQGRADLSARLLRLADHLPAHGHRP